jgi:hypothetical protein
LFRCSHCVATASGQVDLLSGHQGGRQRAPSLRQGEFRNGSHHGRDAQRVGICIVGRRVGDKEITRAQRCVERCSELACGVASRKRSAWRYSKNRHRQVTDALAGV